jgi:hypothetical protein
MKVAGHVDQRHGVHLLGDRVVALVARGSVGNHSNQ